MNYRVRVFFAWFVLAIGAHPAQALVGTTPSTESTIYNNLPSPNFTQGVTGCTSTSLAHNNNSFVTCASGAWGVNPVQIGTATAPPYSCSSTYAGMLYFDTSSTAVRYCDGSSTWQTLSSSVSTYNGGTITVPYGGTGDTSLTAHSVMLGEGTTAVGTAGPGAINTVLIGKGATVDPAFTGAPIISGALTTSQSIGVTSTDGIVLSNTTAAAAGAQQYSPRVHFTGQGWKTTATAASQSIDFIQELQPVQGTTAPTGNLTWSSSVNGSAYSPLITLTSGGLIGVVTTTPTYDLSFDGSVAREIWMERSTSGAGNNLRIQSSGALAGSTDQNAGNLILSSGVSTGTGIGAIYFYTPYTLTASGTADRAAAYPAMSIVGHAGSTGTNTPAFASVGIGTAVPTNTLDAWSASNGSGNGGISMHNTIGSAGFVAFGGGSGNSGASFGMSSTGASSTIVPPSAAYIFSPGISGAGALVLATTINSSSANMLFATGGTATTNERMRITSAGLIGIGTTAPTSLLHTVDSSAQTTSYVGVEHAVSATSATASVTKTGVDIQSTGAWTGTSATNIGLNVNATGGTTNYAALFSGGNIGINTTTPTYDISFDGSAAREMWLERSTTGAGKNLTIQAGGALSGQTDTAGGNLIFNSGISTGGASSSILFNLPAAVGTGSGDHLPVFPGMVIQGQANGGVGIANVHVGIGTASPGNTVDIWGSGTGSGNGGMNLHNTVGGAAYFTAYNNSTGSTNGATFGMSSTTSSTVIPPSAAYIQSPTNNGTGALALVAPGPYTSAYMLFATGGSAAGNERMRITSTGLIGIGSTAPRAALDVAGPIMTECVTVGTLPTGVQGMRHCVTDATSCSFLGSVTGGGSTFCPVVYNGSAWVGG